VKLYTTVRIV